MRRVRGAGLHGGKRDAAGADSALASAPAGPGGRENASPSRTRREERDDGRGPPVSERSKKKKKGKECGLDWAERKGKRGRKGSRAGNSIYRARGCQPSRRTSPEAKEEVPLCSAVPYYAGRWPHLYFFLYPDSSSTISLSIRSVRIN